MKIHSGLYGAIQRAPIKVQSFGNISEGLVGVEMILSLKVQKWENCVRTCAYAYKWVVWEVEKYTNDCFYC